MRLQSIKIGWIEINNYQVERENDNMVEMTTDMQQCFDSMNDEKKIRMFYELTKYMHENLEYGEDDDMNNLIEDIANVQNDIENL